ncbi:hypothetical protein LCGC14_2825100, partial [marine sediment metagenome]
MMPSARGGTMAPAWKDPQPTDRRAGMPIPELTPADLAKFQWLITPALLLWCLVGLGYCFGGYVIFRIHLVFAGVSYGALGGAMLLHALRPEAAGAETFAACLLGAGLLGVVGWWLFRLAFALLAAAGAFAVLFVLTPDRGVGCVFGALMGLGLGALAF